MPPLLADCKIRLFLMVTVLPVPPNKMAGKLVGAVMVLPWKIMSVSLPPKTTAELVALKMELSCTTPLELLLNVIWVAAPLPALLQSSFPKLNEVQWSQAIPQPIPGPYWLYPSWIPVTYCRSSTLPRPPSPQQKMFCVIVTKSVGVPETP